MKPLRIVLEEDDWARLEPFITHHGDISYMVRMALKYYISILEASKTGEVSNVAQTSHRRRPTPPKTHPHR